MLQALGDLSRVVAGDLQFERAAVFNQRSQCRALNQFHHQKVQAAIHLGIVRRHDRWMRKSCGRASFSAKPCGGGFVQSQAAIDHLDHDVTPHHAMPGTEDDAHSTGLKLLADVVSRMIRELQPNTLLPLCIVVAAFVRVAAFFRGVDRRLSSRSEPLAAVPGVACTFEQRVLLMPRRLLQFIQTLAAFFAVHDVRFDRVTASGIQIAGAVEERPQLIRCGMVRC